LIFEVLRRITSDPLQRNGMFEQFSYGCLGFTLCPDGEAKDDADLRLSVKP
jgi:hypothetical protein